MKDVDWGTLPMTVEATRQAAPLDHDDRADSRSDLPDIQGALTDPSE